MKKEEIKSMMESYGVAGITPGTVFIRKKKFNNLRKTKKNLLKSRWDSKSKAYIGRRFTMPEQLLNFHPLRNNKKFMSHLNAYLLYAMVGRIFVEDGVWKKIEASSEGKDKGVKFCAD